VWIGAILLAIVVVAVLTFDFPVPFWPGVARIDVLVLCAFGAASTVNGSER
jgi:hypothetical protein